MTGRVLREAEDVAGGTRQELRAAERELARVHGETRAALEARANALLDRDPAYRRARANRKAAHTAMAYAKGAKRTEARRRFDEADRAAERERARVLSRIHRYSPGLGRLETAEAAANQARRATRRRQVAVE